MKNATHIRRKSDGKYFVKMNGTRPVLNCWKDKARLLSTEDAQQLLASLGGKFELAPTVENAASQFLAEYDRKFGKIISGDTSFAIAYFALKTALN